MDTPIADVVEMAEIPQLESQVFTVGSPIDGLVLSKGVLKDVFEDLTEKWLILQIPADHGSSGGPVFASGGLIGLVISKDKRTGDIYAYTGEDMKNDFKYVSQGATTGQDYKIPITNSDAQILMPIFVSATITFLLGIGIGVLIAKGRKKISKPRIRIEV